MPPKLKKRKGIDKIAFTKSEKNSPKWKREYWEFFPPTPRARPAFKKKNMIFIHILKLRYTTCLSSLPASPTHSHKP